MRQVGQRRIAVVLRDFRYPLQFRRDAFGALDLRHLSLQRFHTPAPPSLRGVPRLGSPPSSVLRGAPTPHRPSRFTSFPSFRRYRHHAGGDEASQVPRDPLHACPALRPRRDLHAGPSVACDLPACRCCLPVCQRRRLSRCLGFRGSMTRPTCSLSTLRSQDRSCATQDSLSGGGQPCPRWISAHRGSSNGFHGQFIAASSISELPDALTPPSTPARWSTPSERTHPRYPQAQAGTAPEPPAPPPVPATHEAEPPHDEPW